MVGFRVAERALGFVSLLVLARLLMPADFGIVAMAMSIVAMIELAGAFGFDVALIRHPDPRRQHFDTVFAMNVLIGIAGAVVLLVLARPVAAFFDERNLVAVTMVLGAAWAVQGFENVGTVLFRRNMEFGREFVFLTAKRVLGFVITLIAAFMLRNYWALVIGMVVGRVASTLLSYAVHPYRPRFSLAALGELMLFSRWLFLGNVVGFLNLRLSTFVIGRFGGPRDLGHYTVAYEIGTLPTSELLAPINRAIIPGFARMAGDPGSLRNGFLEIMGVTTLVAVPAAFGIAALAQPIVRVLLTDKWTEVTPILQVLAFLGAIAAILSTSYPAYYALGRPKIAVGISTVRLAIVLPAMILAAAQWGAIGAAWADLGAAVLTLPVSTAVACRILGIDLRELLGRVWRPFVAAAVMYLTVVRLSGDFDLLASQTHPAIALGAAVVAGVLVYVAMIAVLWLSTGRGPGSERRVLEALRSRSR